MGWWSSEKMHSLSGWFSNCGGSSPRKNLRELRQGIAAGRLNEQEEDGLTALALAVASGWQDGVATLLTAGADPELWHFRTGETPLQSAVQAKNEPMIATLVAAGANPDAANHWGITSRRRALFVGLPHLFDAISPGEIRRPPPHIQNAEHLAEHHYPNFKIPGRKERETMSIGQSVDLYVYGPKSEGEQDTVKVRITTRAGDGSHVRYTATVETPLERTHLAAGTETVEFGPENIASIYVTRRQKRPAG